MFFSFLCHGWPRLCLILFHPTPAGLLIISSIFVPLFSLVSLRVLSFYNSTSSLILSSFFSFFFFFFFVRKCETDYVAVDLAKKKRYNVLRWNCRMRDAVIFVSLAAASCEFLLNWWIICIMYYSYFVLLSFSIQANLSFRISFE